MEISNLTYNPEEGVFYRGNHRAGGSDCSKGYRRIMYNGKRYKEHVLAWYFYYGIWPSNQIDHINGNKSDNRIVNLRDVTQTINMYNKQKAHKNSMTGYLGVSQNRSRYVARIRVKDKLIYLGSYSTPEEAQQHYMEFKDLVQTMD